MTRIRERGEEIRRYILANVEAHPTDVSRFASERFQITRQAVNKHLQRLTAEGRLLEKGHTRNRSYALAPLAEWVKSYAIVPGVAEDVIWMDDIRPVLGQLPDNVGAIWQHGFTEMFNNAVDHSGGTTIVLEIRKTAVRTRMTVYDPGTGFC